MVAPGLTNATSSSGEQDFIENIKAGGFAAALGAKRKFDRTCTSQRGPECEVRDVRYLMAIRGKADVADIAFL